MSFQRRSRISMITSPILNSAISLARLTSGTCENLSKVCTRRSAIMRRRRTGSIHYTKDGQSTRITRT
ncbi:hypothetical protein FFLO_04769 [Filobasidium floriforme]|uniref:Uncharacterized protein n=1 Tax=Filobasidium floriforme TaxID=5210 RepID=A0A8K0JI77_9TREE|nr:hypothetical protein FFLO_04769 [Filobasidium floriforme]